jgi:hypothetical protein
MRSSIMHHTIVAVFQHRADAQHSIDDLLAAGFPRDDIKLSESDPLGPDVAPGADESFIDSIRRFFLDLFGAERHDDVELYAEAVQRGHFVLTLQLDDEEEADRAAIIVERYRPLNMDDYEQDLRTSMPMSGVGPDYSSVGNVQRGGAEGAQAPAGGAPVQPGADLGIAPRSVKVFSRTLLGGVDPADLPAFADPLAQRDDDAAFRAHWRREYADAGGSYDDAAPAYAYGAAMASSGAVTGLHWADVEEPLRLDWTRRHPGQRWEQFRAAVRNGWERIAT